MGSNCGYSYSVRGLLFASLFIFSLAACDCGDASGICSQDPAPSGCNRPCTDDEGCEFGLYCGDDSRCTADCRSDEDCGGDRCEAGRCEGSGTPRDTGGPRRDVTIPDAPGNDGVCAEVTIEARTVTPTVMLIIDQSGSMDADFGGDTRWNVVRDSLLDMDGLIEPLEGSVKFGLALYSAVADGDGGVEGICPRLTTVDPMLNNHAAIETVYGPADILDETPTGASIQLILRSFRERVDPDPDPVIFILATDGEPDTCEEPNPQNGQDESVAAVERAFDEGIRTYIISVGNDVSEGHLQDLANAGQGVAGSEFYVAGDDAGLRRALRDIIGGAISCVVELEGRINPGLACTGTVRLNGEDLACDDPDGWRAIDENHIELLGDACETATGGDATLTASFPCGTILI